MPETKTLLAANQDVSKKVLGPNADAVDQGRLFPRENINALGHAGLLGLLVPIEFGGAGGGLSELSQAVDTQAQYCSSTAMIMLMHYCATAVIAANGSDALKRQILPAMARGEHLSTLAFSEAGSGGHFYIPVSQVHQNGAGKHLSASKSFVTSASEADSYVVSARKASAAGPMESDLYLVFKGAAGLTTLGRFEGLGLAGNDSAPMKLENVKLSNESLLGPEGSGFQTMMAVVLPHFQIGTASVSVGIAAAAFQAASAHVAARKYEHAGGAALATIPRVQFLTAEMAIELECGPSVRPGNNPQGRFRRPWGDGGYFGRQGKVCGRMCRGFVARHDPWRRLGVWQARRPGAPFPRRAGGRDHGASERRVEGVYW